MTLCILDATILEQYIRWAEIWASWPQRDVFAHPGYVRLYASERARPLCAVMTCPGGGLLYPFLARNLEGEPCWRPEMGPAIDITTPYGYGGCYAWGEGQGLADRFWPLFDAWARENHVVSEFMRFSLFPGQLAPYPGYSEERQLNVVRGLDLSEEAMWADFEHKVRKNVKKAQRSGIQVEVDLAGTGLDLFLEIYRQTMDRRAAKDGYYFPRRYFEQIIADLAGNFAFFHALHGDRVVSTELVLFGTENVYSFLGGTKDDAFEVRPNDYLKYEIIRWAKAMGLGRFVLGGGYGGNDGIFRYKLGFAPTGQVPFSVGHRVLNADLYTQLVSQRDLAMKSERAESFFPQYRA